MNEKTALLLGMRGKKAEMNEKTGQLLGMRGNKGGDE